MATKLTNAQRNALTRIAQEPEASLPLYKIKGRMVDKYRVARSLEEKGFVTRTNAGQDSADYLHLTDLARAAIAKAEGR